MFDFLTPVLSRVLASLFGALATYATVHFGYVIPAQTIGQLEAGTLSVLLAVFGIVYAIVHKGIDRLINPADVAKERRHP